MKTLTADENISIGLIVRLLHREGTNDLVFLKNIGLKRLYR